MIPRDLDTVMIRYHAMDIHMPKGYQAGYDDYWHRAQIADSNVNNDNNTAENNANIKIKGNNNRAEINQNNCQANNSLDNSNGGGYGYNGDTSHKYVMVLNAFDKSGRIIEIAHLKPDKSNLLTIQQLYDASGNMRFKNDITSAGNSGEYYKYNSVYWLTKVIDSGGITQFNALNFGPSNVSQPANMLNDQTKIDALIGPLAQNPIDFTYQYDLMGNREIERQSGMSTV
jgi:hypothetical protein